MSSKQKSATITIAGHTVVVDADDAERIAEKQWRILFADQGRELFVTTVGAEGFRPVDQLLGGFILQVKPSVFVEQVKRGSDYCKANLRVHQPKAVAIARLEA